MRYIKEDIRDIIEAQSSLCLTTIGTQLKGEIDSSWGINGLERLQWGDDIFSAPRKMNRNLLTR